MNGLYPILISVIVVLPVLGGEPDTTDWPGFESCLDSLARFTTIVLSCEAMGNAEIVKRHTVDESTAMDMGDGEVLRDGGLVTFTYCRQKFRTNKVLYGKAKDEERVLEYVYVEKSDAFTGPMTENAIPRNALAIVILDKENRIMKALPDTDENRTAVALAFSRYQERKKAVR